MHFFSSGIVNHPLAAVTATANPPAVLAVNAARRGLQHKIEIKSLLPRYGTNKRGAQKKTARKTSPKDRKTRNSVANTRHQKQCLPAKVPTPIPGSRRPSAMDNGAVLRAIMVQIGTYSVFGARRSVLLSSPWVRQASMGQTASAIAGWIGIRLGLLWDWLLIGGPQFLSPYFTIHPDWDGPDEGAR
ncbi:hypothetical protein V502_04553 [Pseudogymnoascus sp. VKM F-4520 (FW-2644)]|nr:hypothetical protein V502_04553 [Pseudogymnoascus sp. VKM F-4520 (FW-2644)]